MVVAMRGSFRGGWWLACLVATGCGQETTGTVGGASDTSPDVIFVPPDAVGSDVTTADADARELPGDAVDGTGDDDTTATLDATGGDDTTVAPDATSVDDATVPTDATLVDDVADATTADPDTSVTTASDADASVVDTSVPAPFCGDGTCNGTETCLDCDDCACPERCGGDLFFTDYLEGDTGFNKALEVGNFTGQRADLAAYAIGKITNGGDWLEVKLLPLAGLLESGDAVVVCHGDADPALLALCDLTSTGDAMQFNGNDAVGLFHGGVLVDAIGAPGDAPTSGFTVAGVANATKDHRLTRRSDVVSGEVDWVVGANQWDVLPIGLDGLGGFEVAASCPVDVIPAVQVNEVRLGAGASDFIELAAGPDAAVDLTGFRVVTTGGQYIVPPGASAMLPAGGFRALGKDTLGFGLGAVDIVWLYDAAGLLVDLVSIAATDFADGQSWGRLPDVVGPWTSLSRATPGAPNEDPDHFCGDGTCDADEGCLACLDDCGLCRPAAGELVVAEVLAEPTAGPEWFEVVSVATEPLELAGLVLADDGADFHALAPAGGSLVLDPGGRLVLGSAAAGPVDYAYAGFALAASDDAIALWSGSVLVDRVAWTTAPTAPGVAWSLDPASTDTAANDAGAAWCAATSTDAAGQLATPGVENPICHPAPVCGDTVCAKPDETCSSCPGDCGACTGCATGLFISEYVEGSSYNKALEIANFTGADVDLGQYAIWKITNAGTWNENAPLYLSGTLPSGEVFVVCKSTAAQAILDVCDLATSQTQLDFNGDDAVGLAHGATLVDALGTEAGSGAVGGFSAAGTNNAMADHTLVRAPSVAAPTTDWVNASATQWLVHAKDDVSDLGRHAVDYVCF